MKKYSMHKNGFPLYTGDISDLIVQPCVRNNGYFELEICEWIDKNIKSGDVVYDIGSNIGEISEMAAYKGAKVYAFDSQKYLCEAWQAIRDQFNLNNGVKIYPVGLSDKKETIKFYKSHTNVGGSSFSEEFVYEVEPDSFLDNNKNPMDVEFLEVVPLSSLNLPDEIPDLIKLDIQGFEARVWDGMTDTMRMAKNIIIEMFIHDAKRDSFRYFADGRKAFDIREKLIASSPDELVRYMEQNPTEFYNILFHK